ncbi:MAG: beta-xylosidase [Saprospiraceae bacterium]
MKKTLKIFAFLSSLLLIHQVGFGQGITIAVDAQKTIGVMKPIWAFWGYDEPNYTTQKNGQKLLSELQALSPVPVYIRAHNLLTSKGNSPGPDLKWGYTDAYTEDLGGKPIYNWVVVDSIIDSYIQLGMKPLVEIGFMPKALSSKPEPYEHYWSIGGNLWTGWTYPPGDYNKWRELVYQWVKHSIDRYGKIEVQSWFWELWNEPDIGYWSGTFEEYCKMYDYASDGLKKACPECPIGGPHTTSPRGEKGYKFLTDFMDHCLHGKNYATGKKGSPLNYVGFHAKGSPELVDGVVRMNMGAQLKDIKRGFEAVNSFPELKNIPVIIGECDPEGCAACSEAREPKYAYRNGTMYSSYSAASFARIYELMDQQKVNLRGAVNWSFEFENQPWFAGYRDMATNGVNKPVMNVFRMLGMMRGNRLAVQNSAGFGCKDIIEKGVREKPDINAIASKSGNSIWIMVWNYHDLNVIANSAEIDLEIQNMVTSKVLMKHYRVDDKWSNSFEKWKKLGRPQIPSSEQFAELEQAGQLQMLNSPGYMKVVNGILKLNFELPRQGVSLIELTW